MITYTAEELALLKNEQYFLTPDGTPKTTKRFLRIEENLLFTIRMVAKLEDVDPDIDLTSEGWRSLKDSVRVRNRVTHPRSEHDLDVSEEEFERLVIGYKWAVHSLVKALAKSYLKLEKQVREVKQQLEKLKTENGTLGVPDDKPTH